MALQSIQFPKDVSQSPYTAPENGVTYIWSDTKKSWIPAIAESDNDYIDSQISSRVSRSGDTMYGSLVFKPVDSPSEPYVGYIDQRGVFSAKKFVFFEPGSVARFNLIGEGATNETQLMAFDTGSLVATLYSTLKISTDLTTTLIDSRGSSGNITLFDMTGKIGSNDTVYSIKIDQSASFSISHQSIYESSSTPRFKVSNYGTTEISCEQDEAFIVRKHSYVGSTNSADIAFYVNAQSHYVLGSADYNKGLIEGKNTVLNSSGTEQTYEYEDDRLLATKGYVDNYTVYPGNNICADKESDAEIGGFWISGGTLFVRLN